MPKQFQHNAVRYATDSSALQEFEHSTSTEHKDARSTGRYLR